jgi:uncharacterized protein
MTLYEAVCAGQLETVQERIAAGEDVNQLGPGKRTPLIEAAAAGNLALVEVLLEAGAEPRWADAEKETALLKAAANGHRHVAAVLLPHAEEDEADMARSFLKAFGLTDGRSELPPEPKAKVAAAYDAAKPKVVGAAAAVGPKVAQTIDTVKQRAATFGARAAKFFGNEDPQERLDRIARATEEREKDAGKK